MDKIFENKNILVTGGSGSIGEEIVKRLLKEDINKLITFGRGENNNFFLKKKLLDKRIECVTGDIRDEASLKKIFAENDFDIIYHAAAMKHVSICERYPLESVKTNILGTNNLVEISKEHNIEKLITISTDKSVNPVNVMGTTKFLAEKITTNAGYSCVRFGNVANSKGSVVPALIHDLLNGNPLSVTDPNVTRFIMRIRDAADLVIEATKYSEGGEIFVLKMKSFKLSDMVEAIKNVAVKRLSVAEKDIRVNYIGRIAGEKLHEDLINSIEQNNTYELNNMYVVYPITNGGHLSSKYKKANLNNYNSLDAAFMSIKELEDIVEEYIDKMGYENNSFIE